MIFLEKNPLKILKKPLGKFMMNGFNEFLKEFLVKFKMEPMDKTIAVRVSETNFNRFQYLE